jgi:hypothetical protein
MQESGRGSAVRSLPHSNFNKFEDIYNEEAYHYRNEEQLRKHLYAKIIDQADQKLQEKKRMEKQLEKMENGQNDLFWKVLPTPRRTRSSGSEPSRRNAGKISRRLAGSTTPSSARSCTSP